MGSAPAVRSRRIRWTCAVTVERAKNAEPAFANSVTALLMALALCYIVNMKKARRAGATETFSVSVDPKTKQALRALANRDFGGNLSAVVTDLAEEARRRMAADAYLHRHRLSAPSKAEADEIETEIGRELLAWKKRPKKRKVA